MSWFPSKGAFEFGESSPFEHRSQRYGDAMRNSLHSDTKATARANRRLLTLGMWTSARYQPYHRWISSVGSLSREGLHRPYEAGRRRVTGGRGGGVGRAQASRLPQYTICLCGLTVLAARAAQALRDTSGGGRYTYRYTPRRARALACGCVGCLCGSWPRRARAGFFRPHNSRVAIRVEILAE